MTSHLHESNRLTEHELIARCLAGDTAAFGDLIDRHRLRLERLLRVLLPDSFLREEVWQETLLRAYLNLEQLRNPERFGSWLCTIAINIARTARSIRGRSAQAWPTWDDGIALTQESPEADLVRQEQMARVRQAIVDLPPSEREAVLLVYLHDLSHQEAANQLGATLSAVKVRVHRGRNRLRAALQAEFAPAVSTSQPLLKRKEKKMIQVTVHDLFCAVKRLTPAADEQPSTVEEAVDSWRDKRIIILKDIASNRVLHIWIGPYEADWLVMHLEQIAMPRPLTYDLVKTLLALGEVKVECATVNRLHDNIYYANLTAKIGDTTSEVDCRPSDAINLAVRLQIPIFVAPDVMEHSQKTVHDPPGSAEYEWKSLFAFAREAQALAAPPTAAGEGPAAEPA